MRMLICSIGSRNQEATLSYTKGVAKALASKVTLLSVVKNKGVKEMQTPTIETVARELADHGLEVKTRLETGDAERILMSELNQETYDLIAMGALGHKRARLSLLESVADRTTERVDSSILFVKGDRRSVSRVLICSSGTEVGRLAVWTGAALACALGAEATLLHVLDPMPAMYTGLEQMEETLSEFLQTDTNPANQIKWAAQVVKAECKIAELKVRRGLVTDEILREAKLGDYDLIVLGSSRSAGSLVRLVMGNISAQVVRQAERPVLVVRPPD